jgi:hypothetical protein
MCIKLWFSNCVGWCYCQELQRNRKDGGFYVLWKAILKVCCCTLCAPYALVISCLVKKTHYLIPAVMNLNFSFRHMRNQRSLVYLLSTILFSPILFFKKDIIWSREEVEFNIITAQYLNTSLFINGQIIHANIKK